MTKRPTLNISIQRYHPERDNTPYNEHFSVPWDEQTSVLDALGYIKDHLAPDLAWRWSCRMAICGSCGVMVDHVPRLACKTFLRDYPKGLHIAPLANFPVERDLVVDMSTFIANLEAIKPYILGNARLPSQGANRQTPAQMARYHQFSGCINCGLCYAACPQFALNPQFIGPAVIALAQRYNLDSRDRGKAARMPLLNGDNGVWPCTFVGFCSEVCPKHVDPAAAIQQGKVESAKDYLIARLKPH